MPIWLTVLSWVCLLAGVASALWIAIDLMRGHARKRWIMNIVWTVTGLYAGPLALWAYYRFGRADRATGDRPAWQGICLSASHCGGGCTLADLIVETSLIFAPALALFGQEIFAAWALDYAAAFAIGIAFQYFSIHPMSDASPAADLWAAVKADTLSLTSWQVGMYGWMAFATFAIFGHPIDKTGPVFWFMMQIAMLFGFATAYPVNAWLIRVGIKESM
ncbi:MAG: DUF4396 domain-containing protein [Rhodanobacteraceae bacterium]